MQVENSRMIYRGADELARVYRGDHVIVWEPGEPHDYSLDYLTFKNVGNNPGVFMFHCPSGFSQDLDIEISKNNGPWIHFSAATIENRTLARGDRMRVKGTNETYSYIKERGANPSQMWVSGDTQYHIFGNIMSLVYGDLFEGETELNTGYTFYLLFGRVNYDGSGANVNNNCVSARNLILPATSLTYGCYEEMLWNTFITKPPQLPATELANRCYLQMFDSCIMLTEAPSLPATVMAHSCYYRMFGGCTSLATAPQLPATALSYMCYEEMFKDCNSLVNAPDLPATSLVDSCYEYMFSGCTSIEKAPDLLADTVAFRAYYGMFHGCSSLNYVKCLATDISATWCTEHWLGGVSPTGTFVKSPNMSSWTTGEDGIPSGWTVIDAT